MAGTQRTRRVLEREDGTLVAIGGSVAAPQRSGGNIADHLHSLQRSHGNRAVTLMVQRDRGRSRPASTDNPNHRAPAPAADFFPKDDVSPGLANRDVAWLEYVAPLEFRNGSKARAIKMYEELAYKQRRDISSVKKYAVPLHLAYGSADPARSAYWAKVAKGDIVPEETKSNAQILKEMEAAEMAGKAF